MNKKFIERKRIITVFLLSEIKLYQKIQKEIEKEGGCFGRYYKGVITKINNALQKMDDEIPMENAYSEKQVADMADKLILIYLKKACSWDDGSSKDDIKVLDPQELKDMLGVNGDQLFRTYLKIKSGFLALTTEIKEDSLTDFKQILKQFETVRKFWEREVLV